MFKKLTSKKGQSTLEYIILVAGVVAVLIVFLQGPMRNQMNNTLTEATDGMDEMATRITDARATAP